MQCNYQQLSIADLKKQQLGASGERVREDCGPRPAITSPL
jgi:hypothetical protein